MELPKIQIQQTYAKLGVETNKGSLEIKQPKADLSIQQPQAEIQYNRTRSRLTIDQTKAWEAMNSKHVFRLIEDFAAKGKRDWLEGLSRVSQQGDELMRIENGKNVIPRQAAMNSQLPQYEFNIGWIPPYNSVKIDYQPSQLEFEVNARKPIIEATPRYPTIQYTPTKIKTYLAQKNSLNIDVIGLNVNKQL